MRVQSLLVVLVGAVALAGCPKSKSDGAADKPAGALSADEKRQLVDFAKSLEAIESADAAQRASLLAEAYGEAAGNACVAKAASAEASQKRAALAGCKVANQPSVELMVVTHVGDWYGALRRRLPDDDALAKRLDAAAAKLAVPVPLPATGAITLAHSAQMDVPLSHFYLVVTADKVTGGRIPEVGISKQGLVWGDVPGGKFPGEPAKLDELVKAARAEGEPSMTDAMGGAQIQPEEPPPPPEEKKAEDDDDNGGQGDGTRMALEEGKMGKKESSRESGQYKMQKGGDEPQLARQQRIEQAKTAGILGVIGTAGQPSGGAGTVLLLADAGLPASRVIEVVTQLGDGSALLAVADRDGNAVALDLPVGAYHQPGEADLPPAIIQVDIGDDGYYLFTPGHKFERMVKDKADLGAAIAALRADPVGGAADGVLVSATGTRGVQDLVDVLAALRGAGLRWAWMGTPEMIPASGSIGASYGTLGHGTGTSFGMSRGNRDGGAPQVKIGTAKVTGDLDKNIIRRYIRRKMPEIEYCYQKRLTVNPDLQGSITVVFVIDASGAVTQATTTGMGDKDFEACVNGAIKSIEFPKPTGGGVVHVSYPFTFKPAGD